MEISAYSVLCGLFGDRVQENIPLSGFTSARIGGPADVLVVVRSADELVRAAQALWAIQASFIVFGGGSNVLVSDKGVRGTVLVNRARQVKFFPKADPPTVFAESGATLNDIAQRSARHGLSGLEWATSVPGTLGGAIYGNAGAFGGEMSHNLITVDLLHRDDGLQTWPVERLGYGYRTSLLKRERAPVILLSSLLKLHYAELSFIQSRMAANTAKRRATQPPGASMGSMFKNPPNEKAGRLIEAAGLKGARIGDAEISNHHANFFLNTRHTRAEDMKALLDLARKVVFDKFGVDLEPEIEVVGEW